VLDPTHASPWPRLVVRGLAVLIISLTVLAAGRVQASDHLDTPTVIADPAADIADLYAWTSFDGRRLNLALTIVGHRFSDRVQYAFHVGSGSRFGKTGDTVSILCRFDAAAVAECWAGEADHLRGDASSPSGLEGTNRRFRVFAGLRDDPFFNNVKGTRAALNLAAAALRRGVTRDPAGCPRFDETTSAAILDAWRHTDGGPAHNFLDGWTSAALVISVDMPVVNAGGALLAVWAGTYRSGEDAGAPNRSPPALGAPIDRIGRPLVGNALIGPIDPEEESDRRKEEYNRAAPPSWAQFAPDFERTLALYDGFDGVCANQWPSGRGGTPAGRYRPLAELLADDRLWVDSTSAVCQRYLAVELAELAAPGSRSGDCGGRTPNQGVSNIFRSLLIRGTPAGLEDGLDRDDHSHSTTTFPFLAAP